MLNVFLVSYCIRYKGWKQKFSEGLPQNLMYSPVNVSDEEVNIDLLLDLQILKKCIFERNKILLVCSAGLWDWNLVQDSWQSLGLISKCQVWLTSGEGDSFFLSYPWGIQIANKKDHWYHWLLPQIFNQEGSSEDNLNCSQNIFLQMVTGHHFLCCL